MFLLASPKELKENNTAWKTCLYGLTDASGTWYLKDCDELIWPVWLNG